MQWQRQPKGNTVTMRLTVLALTARSSTEPLAAEERAMPTTRLPILKVNEMQRRHSKGLHDPNPQPLKVLKPEHPTIGATVVCMLTVLL